MKDYAEMSDWQIAEEVAKFIELGDRKQKGEGTLYVKNNVWTRFDPCNNPADAWPIILQNRISIIFDSSDESDEAAEWVTACVGGEEYFSGYHYCHKALRAAMIVFLMMKEGE